DESIPVEVETSALSGGENFILLEAGTFHNCGLSSYGHIYCWGSDSSGQLGENEDGDNLQEDTPSLVDTSELTDLTGFISLALGNWFSCGLAVNGKAYCWGGDQNGQLGENSDGDNLPENIPVQVDNSALGSGVRFVSLTAGESHACGLSSEGKAYCWGKGFYEQLGNGNFVDQNIPTPVDLSNLPAGSRFVEIHAGGEFTCGLASDGKAYCWGRDNHGQLGENADGDNLDEPIPVAVDTSALSTGTSFSSLVTGYAHACGLSSDGKAYCWGTDSNGQLGENADGDNLDENIPVEVDTSAFTAGSSFKSLAAGGGSHTCGLASDGKAYCWGLDNKGQLGENADGDNLSESIPVAVDTSSLTPGSQFISLHLGGAHSCGIASDGKAYCWGDDQYGQLGENADSDNLDENIPVEVNSSVLGPGGSFTALSLGGGHTCGLSSSGKAYCWGANFFGQLGESPSGGNLKEDIPVEVDDSAL
ncbi:MAG: hypothetical protein KDD35_08685, partial [Bdellovibrionales bacterium]|nr:hypothetical protein [Bdellovibrionales bacterium]